MILAIDTCGAVGGVALAAAASPGSGDASHASVSFRLLAGKTFSERLLATISEALAEASSNPSHLDAVVVVHGPGSFTGIRIGVSAAKGFAEALRIPLIAVSRLELLARKSTLPAAMAVLDAGRGEFFAGVYRQGDGADWLREMEGLLSREQTIRLASDLDLPMVACEPQVAAAFGAPPSCFSSAPTAADAVILGSQRWRRGDFDDVATLDANYLRRSETEMLARIAEHAAIRAAETAFRERAQE